MSIITGVWWGVDRCLEHVGGVRCVGGCPDYGRLSGVCVWGVSGLWGVCGGWGVSGAWRGGCPVTPVCKGVSGACGGLSTACVMVSGPCGGCRGRVGWSHTRTPSGRPCIHQSAGLPLGRPLTCCVHLTTRLAHCWLKCSHTRACMVYAWAWVLRCVGHVFRSWGTYSDARHHPSHLCSAWLCVHLHGARI